MSALANAKVLFKVRNTERSWQRCSLPFSNWNNNKKT